MWRTRRGPANQDRTKRTAMAMLSNLLMLPRNANAIASTFPHFRLSPAVRRPYRSSNGGNRMGRNVLAAIAIFLCTTAGWMILGASIVARTADAGSGLGPRVESTWGAPQDQTPPAAFTTREVERVVEATATEPKKVVKENVNTPLSLESSRLRVALAL